jgi:hypothetical protein
MIESPARDKPIPAFPPTCAKDRTIVRNETDTLGEATKLPHIDLPESRNADPRSPMIALQHQQMLAQTKAVRNQ